VNTLEISTNGVSPTNGLVYPGSPGYYEVKVDLNKVVQTPIANTNPTQYTSIIKVLESGNMFMFVPP